MADRPTYGGGEFTQAWQPSFGPGSSEEMLRVEAAKRGAWLASMDQFMTGIEEQQRQFDLLLEQREEEFEETLGFKKETLGLEREKFEFEKESWEREFELEEDTEMWEREWIDPGMRTLLRRDMLSDFGKGTTGGRDLPGRFDPSTGRPITKFTGPAIRPPGTVEYEGVEDVIGEDRPSEEDSLADEYIVWQSPRR